MDSRKALTDLALIAVFAALIAAFSWTAIAVPAVPVPITLQTLGVALAGLVLGPWRGLLSVLLYLGVGFAGLPVFAGGAATFGVLSQASAGYLIAFPFSALIAGFLAQWLARRGVAGWKLGVGLSLCALAGSIVVIHPLGIAGLVRNAHLTWPRALAVDMTFWIGDVIKCAAAGAIAVTVHKAFPALLAKPVARSTHDAGAEAVTA